MRENKKQLAKDKIEFYLPTYLCDQKTNKYMNKYVYSTQEQTINKILSLIS